MFQTWQQLAAFLLGTLAVMATPGITVSAITGNTLSYGARSGLAMEAGALLARVSMIITLAIGLGAVAGFMAAAFDWIKLIGAGYLIIIGIRMIRNPPGFSETEAPPRTTKQQVLSGFLVLWSNPKAFLFFGAFLPQFIDTNAPVWPQVLILGTAWLIISFATDSTYIVLANGARHLMRGAAARRLGWASGGILIAAGLWLAIQQKA